MQEAPLSPSPTQRKLSVLKAHYSGFPGNNQWGNQWLVCSFGGVGILYPCAAFVVLMGKPTGAGKSHPQGQVPLRQREALINRSQPQSPSSSRLVVVANSKQPKEALNKETLQSQLGSPLAASGINPSMTHLILNRKHST